MVCKIFLENKRYPLKGTSNWNFISINFFFPCQGYPLSLFDSIHIRRYCSIFLKQNLENFNCKILVRFTFVFISTLSHCIMKSVLLKLHQWLKLYTFQDNHSFFHFECFIERGKRQIQSCSPSIPTLTVISLEPAPGNKQI